MRIILKPMGAVLTIGVLGLLCYTALHYRAGSAASSSNPAERSAAEPTADMTAARRRIYPQEGLPVISDDPGQWNLVTPSDTQARLDEKTSTTAPAGKRELVFDVQKRPDKSDLWLLKIQRPLPVPLLKGNDVKVEFWGRSAQPGNLTILLTKTGNTELTVAAGSRPAADLFQDIAFTPEWKHYVLRIAIKQDYPAYQASLQFQPDRTANTFELTQIMATDFGPTDKNKNG